MIFECLRCDKEIRYDEGEGNDIDGYTCFECLEELKEYGVFI